MELEQKGQTENAQGLLQPTTLVGTSGHNSESWREKIHRSSLGAFSMLPVTNCGEGWVKPVYRGGNCRKSQVPTFPSRAWLPGIH